MSMDKTHLQMEHKRSQLWAALRDFRDDIERLATGGLNVEHESDLNLVELLALTVQGELDARKAEVDDGNV